MAHYILLMRLTDEGRRALFDDADSIVRAHSEVDATEVTGLGLYAVLGEYDVVGIIEANDNEAAARYSLELGLRIGAHIVTLPAVPLSMLDDKPDNILESLEHGLELTPEH